MIDDLIQQLQDSDAEVRRKAIMALGRSKEMAALRPLAQIVRGASSKEAGRALGVSPRTVEFHRANIMQKFGTKNVVDLLTRVLGQTEDSRTIGR